MKIAIIGKMRSGKDTAGDYLVDMHGCKRFAFGDEIGRVIQRYFPQAHKKGKPRHHYQLIGQTFRQLDPDVWINALDTDLFFRSTKHDNVVITDVRQQNEIDYLRSKGFVILKITADEPTRLKRIANEGDRFDPATLQHETETAVDGLPYDFEIQNEGTPVSFLYKVELLVSQLKAGDGE